MSQVIVTNDDLNSRRSTAAEQEKRIPVEGEFAKWQRSDVVGFDPIKSAVGLAVLPIVAIWGFILGCISVAFGFAAVLSRVVGSIFGRKK